MNKKTLSWLLTFIMIFSMFGGISLEAFGQHFIDIENHWAKTDIEKWAQQSLINGYVDGTFKPNDNITRAEFITLVNNVINIQVEEEISFIDVEESEWYYKDLRKAIHGEYISGYEDNTFRANNNITRQEVAVILQHLIQLEGTEEESLEKFNDTKNTPDWSKTALQLAVQKGYLSGYRDNTLKASNYITRAESVKVLNNMFGIIYNESGVYGPSVDEEVLEVKGNVTVSVQDITLQNMIIDGDLYLAEGIGEGDVTLDNITVIGDTIVKGGGDNSIIIKNSSLTNLLIIKKDGKIRIIAQGNTNINNTYLYSSAKLHGERLNVNSFGKVEVIRVAPGEIVEFEGSFVSIDVKASADIEVTGTSKVDELNIHKDVENVNILVSPYSVVDKLNAYSEIGVINRGIILEALGDFARISNYDVKLPVNLQPRTSSGTSTPSVPKYSLSLSVNPVGSGTVTGAGSYEEGRNITITALANDDYEFVEWKDGESQITTSSSFSYTTTSENKTFTAHFESTGELTTPEDYFQFDSETGTITRYFAKGQSGDLPEILHPVIPTLLGGNVPVRIIGEDAFEGNLLESIIIPNGVTTIGDGAFRYNKLSDITIPDSVAEFGNGVFYRNEFTDIPQLPSGITYIPRAMFGENLITQISIPNHITRIEENAFIQNQITSISSANLNNVTYIGAMAFDNNQINSLEFNSALEEIGHQAFSHNLLTNLVIPTTLKMVSTTAFWDNDLISISIGDQVEIKDYALHRNQLTTITIGTNVTLGSNLLAGLFGFPANNLFRDAYQANGAGTYTGTQTGNWTKVESDFAGGTGTELDPFQVATADHLNNVRDYLDNHFIQTADINLGVSPWNEDEGWEPIGSDFSNAFNGTFNGNSFKINNILIDRPSENNIGLFGINKGTLKNISLENVNITGNQYVGGLVGSMGSDAISLYGSVVNSYTSGNVSGNQYVGGLAGASPGNYLQISKSYSSSSVHGNWGVGGLVGMMYGSISDCYAAGNVTGISESERIGGLVGETYGSITNSYSYGFVSGTNDVGGLLGYEGNATSSYYNSDTSGQSDNTGKGTPKTTSEMQNQSTYVGWDFSNVWTINSTDNNGYPALEWQGYSHEGFAGGTGTELDPFLIETASHLNNVRNYLGLDHNDKHFKLNNNINLAEYLGEDGDGHNEGAGWLPLGQQTETKEYEYFTGVFDGNGKTISNLYINRTEMDRVGLFRGVGYATGQGSIKNLNLEDAVITGKSYVGVLAGRNTGNIEAITTNGTVVGYSDVGGVLGLNETGSIKNSTARGSVTTNNSNGQYIGGIVGRSIVGNMEYCVNESTVVGAGTHTGGLAGWSSTSITHSSNTGTVTGSLDYTGGLVGYNKGGHIKYSFNSGTVTGTGDSTGGLVGISEWYIEYSYNTGRVTSEGENSGGLVGYNRSKILDSYNWGEVQGVGYTGGLVGRNEGMNSGSYADVSRTYSAGVISGGDYTGGLIGSTESFSSVGLSFWDTETSTQTASAGGTGKTTIEMKQQSTYPTTGMPRWDFTDIWNIDEGSSYPYLQWQESANIPYPPADK